MSMVRPQGGTPDTSRWGAHELSNTLPRPGAALGRRPHAASTDIDLDNNQQQAAACDSKAVDYGMYDAAGEQQLVLDLGAYQLEAEAQHRLRLEAQEQYQQQNRYPGRGVDLITDYACEQPSQDFSLGLGFDVATGTVSALTANAV